MSQPLLHLSGVRKSFAGVRALANAALDLHPGEVTALIGENGAGKSTLVKILTGVHHADAGEIIMDGVPVRIGSADAARRLGISVIHQEAVIFDDLTVAENIFVSDRPRRRGLVDWRTMRSRARSLMADLEADIDPDTPMRSLSVAQKHLVQIARALSHDARVVIMDEPTAALSHREVDDLFLIVRRLKAEGRAVLFISHKFEEVFEIADRYAVFRDGEAVGAGRIEDATRDELIRLMVGRSVDQIFPKARVPIGPVVLQVDQLSRQPEYEDISFSVHAGEILGVYGLVGSGRSEVMQSVFGLTRPSAGTMRLQDAAYAPRNPAEAIARGVAYVPEDRQGMGAILPLPIVQNIALPSLARLSAAGFLRPARELGMARGMMQRLDVRASGPQQRVEELSGGNQQKVVIGKWLATNPRVLILDEPTKGIDVGSKAAVHQFMSELVGRGLAVVMISSELPEVLGMADRVLVMRRGRVRTLLDRVEATPERTMRAATDA